MIEHVMLFMLALSSGAAVATGTFAFILVIGIVPRVLRKAQMYNVILTENIIILGITLGNISSLWHAPVGIALGRLVVVIYGLATGMFVGCIAVALAEIMHTIPIMTERFRIGGGIRYIIMSMAVGKLVGTLFYFLSRFDRF